MMDELIHVIFCHGLYLPLKLLRERPRTTELGSQLSISDLKAKIVPSHII